MFRLFIKRMISLSQVITGQYLPYAKLEKQWNDVSINIVTTLLSLTKSQIHFNQALSPVAPLPVSFVIHITYYDTSVYIIVDLPQQADRILNADLQTLSQWANSWLVTFNPNKTASMIFSRKLNPVQHPSLFMNGNTIKETTSHKHLGLTFSSTCIRTDHVNSISDKIWTRLNLLRSLKFRVSRKSL